MYCLYHVTSLSTWHHRQLDQHVIDMAVRNGAPVCAHVSRRKADTLNTNLASSFRPLLAGHITVLVNDFNVYQCLLLIFIAVSVIVDFCRAVFIRFVQLVTLEVWWSIWHLLTCHRLLQCVWGLISTGFVSWQRYCAASSSGWQPNFASLNRGRHLCSAVRPLRWAFEPHSSF